MPKKDDTPLISLENYFIYRIRGDGLSDIKEDLAFMNRCRGNPTKSDGEDCMSMGEIKVCGTVFTVEASKAEER
jgi:hypothetical protein